MIRYSDSWNFHVHSGFCSRVIIFLKKKKKKKKRKILTI